ncbi:MAG: hypothetical protein HC836_35360 [Richelia sp. RM2_1_2]|nr:hypothetical protein [Richelia sp. RM2_1_2]
MVKHTDNIESEIDDFVKGQDIYNKIRDYAIDNFGEQMDRYPDFLVYYLQELYKLPAQQFVQVINGILTNLPNRRLLQNIATDVFHDLRADDMDDALDN